MQENIALERRALIISVIGALFMAALGIGFSLVTHSNAVLLDGIFSLIGFAAGLIALRVSRLVQQPDDSHYQFGYGGFEALFNLLKGITIAMVATFALTDAINAILAGGRPIQAGIALFYAIAVGITCFIVAMYLRSAARKTKSPLVELDSKNWILDGLLTVAVLIAFATTILIENSEYAWMATYADPVIVATLVLLIIPVPYITIRDNIKQLLLGAPDQQMQTRVHELLAPELEKIDKLDYLVRMTKVGRYLYIQVFVQFSAQSAVNDIAAHDVLRQRLNDTITNELPNTAVDLILTLDKKWFGSFAQPA
ncbi:cation diffusion facilitator family transporter [Kaarinaea lacus]